MYSSSLQKEQRHLITKAWSSSLRHTLQSTIQIEGIGAHSGIFCQVRLHPLHSPQGIVLNGLSLSKWFRQARWATWLTHPENGQQVSTPEHLLAALYGAGIDDVLIEVSCTKEDPHETLEIPMLDGSALPWLSKLTPIPTAKGIYPRQWSTLPSAHLTVGYSSIQCSPQALDGGDLFTAQLTLTLADLYPELLETHQDLDLIQQPQVASWADAEQWMRMIAPARTFGLRAHEQTLRAQGLIQGVSEESCLLLDDRGQAHRTLHHSSELAAHKLLDCMGDLALLNRRWIGHLDIQRGSHSLNHALLELLDADGHDCQFP